MVKNNIYKKYLEAISSQQETPEQIIRDVIKDAIGKELLSKKRIIVGEVNEVYEIGLSDKTQVILRISPNDSHDFQQEQWAIKKCGEIGVPVPKILSIKYLHISGVKFGFCLMKKSEGETLDRGNIDFTKLTKNQQRNYINQAGEILSKIHLISTKGFGKIIKNGKAQYKDAGEMFVNFLNNSDFYEKIAKEENLSLTTIKNAMKLLKDFKGGYLQIEPTLNHGDYSQKHFMVKKHKIINILDWGEIRSDSPIYDFANWDFWNEHFFPLEWLKERYSNKKIFNSDFNDIFHLIKIMIGLEVFDWYHKQKCKEIVDRTKAKLTQEVKYFN